MKIGIITFHWGINYGANLQAYALQEALKKLNNEVEIIDYYPSRYKIDFFHALMKIKIGSVLRTIKSIPKAKLFEDFRKKRLNRTKYYSSNKKLCKEEFGYDCYICGSDQIWNESFLRGGERKKTYSYFLNFAPDDKIIASYAASFGTTKYNDNLKEDLKKSLNRFDFLSVRENTGLEILGDVGFNNAVVVPDPALLLEKTDYEKLFENKKVKSKYAFKYILHNYKKGVGEISDKLESDGYDIVECSDKGVEAWLEDIYNSEYVFTNSFHGIVFSILFEKPFTAILIDGSGMNDRIVTLLKSVGLEDRIYCEDNNINTEIQWDLVRIKVQDLRKKGYDYLKTITNYKKGKGNEN